MKINRQRNYYSVPKRILRKVLITSLIVGIPVILFLFSFGIKKIEISGSNRYTQQQMKKMILQSRFDYNSVYLYLKYRYITKPDIPFVEKLDVEITGKHKVTVYVYEKMVTGGVEFMGEYLYFDKDGMIVESSPKKIEDVPVIYGLRFNEIVLHRKLKVLNSTEQGNKLFHVILNLTQLIKKYDLDVDTISFGSNNQVTLKCGDIKVLLGSKSNYDEALADLNNILAKAKNTALCELDMRDYTKNTDFVIGKSKSKK